MSSIISNDSKIPDIQLLDECNIISSIIYFFCQQEVAISTTFDSIKKRLPVALPFAVSKQYSLFSKKGQTKPKVNVHQ